MVALCYIIHDMAAFERVVIRNTNEDEVIFIWLVHPCENDKSHCRDVVMVALKVVGLWFASLCTVEVDLLYHRTQVKE